MSAFVTTPPPRIEKCPVCRRPAVRLHHPFCSETCRNRDLLAWLDEGYVLPGPPATEEPDR